VGLSVTRCIRATAKARGAPITVILVHTKPFVPQSVHHPLACTQTALWRTLLPAPVALLRRLAATPSSGRSQDSPLSQRSRPRWGPRLRAAWRCACTVAPPDEEAPVPSCGGGPRNDAPPSAADSSAAADPPPLLCACATPRRVALPAVQDALRLPGASGGALEGGAQRHVQGARGGGCHEGGVRVRQPAVRRWVRREHAVRRVRVCAVLQRHVRGGALGGAQGGVHGGGAGACARVWACCRTLRLCWRSNWRVCGRVRATTT